MSQHRGPVLSVVDYDAWRKGYMPPSEHILIDQLTYRGAKIALSSDNGEGQGAFWFVIRDKRPSRKAMRAIVEMLMTCFEDEPELPTAKPRFEIVENGPLSFVLVDNENDEPAPCYTTREEAEAAMREAEEATTP